PLTTQTPPRDSGQQHGAEGRFILSNCSGSFTDTIYRLSSSCQPEGNQSYQMSDDTNAGVIDMRACIDGQWGTRPMLLPLDTCIMLSGVNSYPGKLSCVSGQLRVIPFDDAACSMATANADAIVENLTFAVPGTCKMVMLPFGELSEQCLSPEVPLLFGEASVSQCRPNPARLAAKTQRATALDFLIEQLGADVSVLDQEDATDDTPNRVQEKTPAQVAAKLKHKEVFWAVIKHGSIVTDQDVLPKEAQSIRNRTKRGVQVLSSGSLEAEGDEKNWAPSELRERLQQSGLNLGLYGHEGHKSLEDLVAELHTCQSELVTGPGKRIHRRVKLVRLQLLAIIDNSVRALVEVQSDAWLRAAHQKLGKLPCRRIRQDETVEEAMKALMLDLGMPEHLLEAPPFALNSAC
ncbi:MCAT, partial [Symbiodinium necroappetens]